MQRAYFIGRNMLAIADLLPGGEPSSRMPAVRHPDHHRPTGRFRRQPAADSAGKTRKVPDSPDRPRKDCQPSSLPPTRNRHFDSRQRAGALQSRSPIPAGPWSDGGTRSHVGRRSEQLCGHSFSASAISEINKKLDAELGRFARRELESEYPYLIIGARYEKLRENGVIRSRAVWERSGSIGKGDVRSLAWRWPTGRAPPVGKSSCYPPFAELDAHNCRGDRYAPSGPTINPALA